MTKDYVITFKESGNPLQDIIQPTQKRIGYIDGKVPILPIYFYRYMGIHGTDSHSQDNYDNELFELDEQLKGAFAGYVRIEQSIPMPKSKELETFQPYVGKFVSNSNFPLKEHVLQLYQEAGVFRTNPRKSRIQQSYQQIMELYLQNESNVNVSKIENFALKMMIWVNRYYPLLFTSAEITAIPKIIFYGDVKTHEAYFLFLISLIGADVLYIHSDVSKDNLFDELDSRGQYSKKHLLQATLPLRAFPTTDKRIRRETVAFQASQEIDEMLYGDDLGIYKAGQYDSGDTKAVTLKTTHDEMKILWEEKAKIRPEFQVKNNTVYVPNVFVKVNGTYEDMDEYWEEIYTLKDAEMSLFLPNVDFTPVFYSRQQMYSTVFLLNAEGVFDLPSVLKDPVYPLGHLRDSTQHFILNKINELIVSNPFIAPMNVDLKVKILMTILTMGGDFLRLVEAFDYTGDIPKLVTFVNKRENFTDSDMILLTFFNVIGADIVIYTPTNFKNVEQWLSSDVFDVHQLPSVQFDTVMPERKAKSKKGFLQRLLNRN